MPVAQKPDVKDLPALARRTLAQGPHKTLPGGRRVRVLLGGSYLFDSIEPVYVWEHIAYPQFYLPAASLSRDVNVEVLQEIPEGAKIVKLSTPLGASTDRVIQYTAGGEHGLKDMFRVEFDSVDGWFEEDTPMFVHPKDPNKRIETLASSRKIKVSLKGKTLAETSWSVHLHETGLPTRYYLPLTAADLQCLKKSAQDTRSKCPYKGEAQYYDVHIDGETFPDLVWYYTNPTQESAAIANLVCFYNEKVDIEIDGVKSERPKTWFS